VNDGDLVRRISDALHRSWRGRVIATPAEQLAQDIAWEIAHLCAEGRESYIKREQGDAWLPSALLEAAERGLLREIADLVDGGDSPVHPGRYRVIQAYADVHVREKRAPMIGELLKELGIDKPKLSKDTAEQWHRVDNRERVIRKTLKQFNLPLSAGKRGRR
jgi:hypothetical protein